MLMKHAMSFLTPVLPLPDLAVPRAAVEVARPHLLRPLLALPPANLRLRYFPPPHLSSAPARRRAPVVLAPLPPLAVHRAALSVARLAPRGRPAALPPPVGRLPRFRPVRGPGARLAARLGARAPGAPRTVGAVD